MGLGMPWRPKTLCPLSLSRYITNDTAGVAGIEFALLFPILLLIVAASVDISEALYARGKVEHVAAIIAGFISDQKQWENAEVDDLLKGSAFVMAPFSADDLAVAVSVLSIDKNGIATVSSSRAFGTTALKIGSASPIAVPEAILTPDVDVVLAQVGYALKTPFSKLWLAFAVQDKILFSQYYFARPRRSDKVLIQ